MPNLSPAELEQQAKDGANASEAAQVAHFNAQLLARYNQAYADWKFIKDNHPDYATPMPTPPHKLVANVAPDGWPGPETQGDPVCPTPVYVPPGPVTQPPTKFLIGNYICTTADGIVYYQCMPGDSVPDGEVTPPGYDPRGIFQKKAFTFGGGTQESGAIGGWYIKIG